MNLAGFAAKPERPSDHKAADTSTPRAPWIAGITGLLLM